MSERSELPRELESLLGAGGAGPARRIDAASAQRLIDGALDAAYGPEQRGATVTRLRGKRVFWMLAAAIVFTGSAAAMYAAQRGREDGSAIARAGRARVARVETGTEPGTGTELGTGTRTGTEPGTGTELGTGTEPGTDTAPAGNSRAAEGRIQDLLRRANRLRGDGQYQAAERTYLRAAAESRNRSSAYTARVAAASLRLERLSDPRGALRLYEQALRADPDGPLTPEIHEGMAAAYRRLGKPAQERRALRTLVERQPTGPAAERARARLQQLD